jgi:hypothetical protein
VLGDEPGEIREGLLEHGFHERKIPEPEAASADQLDLTDP